MTATRTALSTIHSEFLGDIVQTPGSELFLPAGLPGFELERNLLPIEIPAHRPLVFLQSTTNPKTCFVCLPVSSIASDFTIQLSEEDRLVLELDMDRELAMGEDILCLALLLPLPGTVRANLDAPIVINLRNYRCAQIVTGSCNGSRRLAADGSWEPIC